MTERVRIAAVDMGSNTTRVIVADVAFGADGAGTIAYGLTLAAGSASGLQTAIGDQPITLVQTDANTITGVYGEGGSQTAFAIDINADGTITVTQHVPLEHLVDGSTDAAHDDALDLSNDTTSDILGSRYPLSSQGSPSQR